MRILVAGMVAGDPGHGGATWAVLQYVLGLRALGHDVWLVDPAEPTAQAQRYFRTLGLGPQAFLGHYSGPVPDLLLNISGMLRDERILDAAPIRVYLDLDPAFNQLWHAQGVDAGFEGHTHFVTVGRRIGRDDCPVPTGGVDWIGTLPPVVLDEWPVGERIERDAFTTVANWRGYGSIEHDGIRYGQKAHSLRTFVNLPTRSRERFALALAIHPEETRDLEALAANGWTLLDPHEVAGTPAAFRSFLQGSKAELGIAKEGYVVSRCGWFSDRSACYLASARPVVAQDTGFGEFLPAGAGLFAFASTEEAVAAIEEIERDYGRHARAARAIAEEFLDAERVLRTLLHEVGAIGGRPLATVHDEDLDDVLAALGRPIAAMRRRPSAYRSTAPIAELEVEFADGGSVALLLKDLSREALGELGQSAKHSFLHDPLREIDVYRHVLANEDLGTPRFYGAVVDPERGRYRLLIERVGGIELYQVGDVEVWKAVMRWLGRLHERLRQRRLPASLLQHDGDSLLRWAGRAESISGVALPTGLEGVAEQFDELPRTFLHGELYASNVLVCGERVCAVDWETAAVGPAVLDLAAVTAGWDADVQEVLVEEYARALESPVRADRLRRGVDYGRLYLALQWLGWSAEWTPPPEHAHDWRRELEQAVARLGLEESQG